MSRISLCWILLFVVNLLFSQNIPDSLQEKLAGKSPKDQINYLLLIANNSLKTNPQAALSLAITANSIAVNNSDKNNEVKSAFIISKASRLAGKASVGLDYISKAITILMAANQKQYLAQAYNEQGLLFKEMNKWNDAITAFSKGVSLYEELGDKKTQYLVVGNLGDVYNKSRQFKQAIETFQKAKKLAEELGDKKEIAISLNLLGVAYANYGNATEATNQLTAAKEIANSIGNTALANQIQTNLDNLQQNLAFKNKTEFEKEQEKEKEQYISSLQAEYQNIKQLAAKSFEEIEKLKIEDQVKELKIKAIQGEFEKQRLENEMKEQNLKLLEAEKKQKDAEIQRQNETLAYQKRIMVIIGIALAIVFLLLIFVIRLYISNKRTLHIVRQQKQQIEQQKNEIELINKELAHQNTIIRESIDYAKHIQFAILPSPTEIQKHLPNFFVFFKPRDVVSGDFYWFYQNQQTSILATVDCTGHGVPGAFMSLIADSLLNKIVKEKNIHVPSQILAELNREVIATMSQSGDELDNSMDITVCAHNKATNEVLISMAGHSCVIIKPNNQIEELDGKDYVIGGVFADINTEYKLFNLSVVQGTSFYFYSDGFPDQIGGTEKRKLGQKAFVNILLSAATIEPAKRSEFLEKAWNDWKGDKKQVDDVIVTGFSL